MPQKSGSIYSRIYRLFSKETTVDNVSILLVKTKNIEKTKKLSSSISTVLTNWVNDGILSSRKVGKINYYKFKDA